MKDENKSINIIYNKKTLCSFPYKPDSSVKDLKELLQKKYFFNLEDIIFSHKDKILDDENAKLKSIVHTSRDITLKNIISKFKFCQMENEENAFDFNFDIIDTSIDDFQKQISAFFKQKMDEFNFNISKFEFFNEDKPFFDKNKTFHMHFKEKYKEPRFYFLIRDCAIHFNSKASIDEKMFNDEIDEKKEDIEEEEKKELIELRKNVEAGKCFKIIIQTYNHLIKEVEVYPEMTIDTLKNIIEKEFMVSKEHQELLYLVYKLDDNNKQIKDYYIRPNGIIFLRGFYFPLVFVDYFDKKNKNIISINIAEQIKYIRKKIINLLNLEENYNYKLLLNGKTLDDNDYLINSNVQRMQMIYFK
jgi:hypothetical protein